MSMWKEFKAFAVKGNAIDLAVGVVIGAAFSGVVNSLVKDIITPPMTLLTGGLNFADKFIVLRAGNPGAVPPIPPVHLTYGVFLTALINFLIVSFAIFMLIRLLSKLKSPDPVAAPGGQGLPLLHDDDPPGRPPLPAVHLRAPAAYSAALAKAPRARKLARAPSRFPQTCRVAGTGLVRPHLRRAHARPAGGVAAHRRREERPHRLAHRHGQDAGRFPGRAGSACRRARAAPGCGAVHLHQPPARARL